MLNFTPIFQSDIYSGFEVEGFWVMFSNSNLFLNLNLPMKSQPNLGWDNRETPLETNTIYFNGNFECSFYPNDIFSLDSTTVAIHNIRSWYLLYRLPMISDRVSDYRIAVGMSTGEYPLTEYWYMQNVFYGNMTPGEFHPILIEESNYPENLLRRRFLDSGPDTSAVQDRDLWKTSESDLMSGGLYDNTRCVLLT